MLRIMNAKSAADSVVRGLRRGFSLLVARVKALRGAVRADNFRMAQRLRLALPLYVRHLEAPLRNDIVRLFEVSGLWVRNTGDRHQTKRSTLQIIRRILSRLKIPTSVSVADAKLASMASLGAAYRRLFLHYSASHSDEIATLFLW